MGTNFRDWPWPLQGLVYLVGAVAIVAIGLYVPGLPNQSMRQQLEAANQQLKPLNEEVASLRVYKQRRAELQSEMDALQKQLATLQTIVPEDKQADQFILMVQREALGSGVAVRTLVAQPIASKPYYYEMPFQVTADGPYFNVLDFFGRLGRLSRIINIGDLKMTALASGGSGTFHMTPGTSINGSFTVTTFFTKPADQPAGAAAPAKK
jgi:type IV pilus assembly protein PilO